MKYIHFVHHPIVANWTYVNEFYASDLIYQTSFPLKLKCIAPKIY